MKVRKRKNIEGLSDQVDSYDFVLTVDERLASQVQSNCDNAVVVTPERLVSDESFSHSQELRALFTELVSNTEFTWKQASYILDNVLECWMFEGTRESILEHDFIDEKQLEVVFNVLKDFDFIYNRLDRFKLSQNYEVAVIDSYKFNNLQKSVLPKKYDEIDLLSDKSVPINEFKIFNSSDQIVEAIADNISRQKPENCAIVINKESDLLYSIYAALESRKIPYFKEASYSENEDLREFLNLIEMAISNTRIRYKDVKHIVNDRNFSKSKYDNYLFDSLDSKEIRDMKEFLNVADLLTFEEIVEKSQQLLDIDTDYLLDLIDLHEFREKKITLDRLNSLKYYIRNFESEFEKQDDGVLFVDSKNYKFTNREHLFFVGMDADWTKSVKDKPWINKQEEQRKNIRDFQRILQLGQNQHYLVQDTEKGEKVVPCLYFEDIRDKEYENFLDFEHQKVKPKPRSTKNPFKKEENIKTPSEINKISQSDLNTFVMSPRLYYFSKVARDAERKEMTRGNLFHDFAELYVNKPDFVQSRKDEYFVEIMYDELEKFVDPVNDFKIKTELLSGIKSLKKYIDHEEIIEHDYDSFQQKRRNIFERKLNVDLETQLSEMRFEDDQLGIKGKVDLIKSPYHLVDYKSGRKSSEKQIVKKSNPQLLDDDQIYPDFQAILYLTYLRKQQPGERLKFTFFHLLEELEDDINNGIELDKKKTTLKYYPKTFNEKLEDIEIFEMLISDVSKSHDRRKTLEKLNYERYKSFFKEHNKPDFFDKEDVMKSEFAAEFIEYAKKEVGNYKYVEKGCKSSLKKLVEFRKTNYFKEDLDKFEQFIKEKIEEINNYRKTSFPLKSKDVDKLPNRDLILKGETLDK